MIIDLDKFLLQERGYWEELERWLNRLESDHSLRPSLKELQRINYLYERTASALTASTSSSRASTSIR